jgi:hypothetical protein
MHRNLAVGDFAADIKKQGFWRVRMRSIQAFYIQGGWASCLVGCLSAQTQQRRYCATDVTLSLGLYTPQQSHHTGVNGFQTNEDSASTI